MSTPPHDDGPHWRGPDGILAGSRNYGTSGYDPNAEYTAPPSEPRQYSLLKRLTLVS